MRKLPTGWEVVTLAESGLKNPYIVTAVVVLHIFLKNGSINVSVLSYASLPKGWK